MLFFFLEIPFNTKKTKHIELDIHFVREKVACGQVRVLHVSSRYQIADIFMKGLPCVLFDDFRASLIIRPPPYGGVIEYLYICTLFVIIFCMFIIILFPYS